jgi:hypothetical protein
MHDNIAILQTTPTWCSGDGGREARDFRLWGHSEAGEIQRILRRYRDREADLANACLIDLGNEFGSSFPSPDAWPRLLE